MLGCFEITVAGLAGCEDCYGLRLDIKQIPITEQIFYAHSSRHVGHLLAMPGTFAPQKGQLSTSVTSDFPQ